MFSNNWLQIQFEINASKDACEGYSSKKLAIFSFGDLVQNISISSGKQYLSKQEVRKLSLIINIIRLFLSFLSNLYIAE